MDEDHTNDFENMDDSKRQTRNRNEKKRRDQFNLLVNELNTIVTTSNKRLDKSSVLMAAIAFLKSHNESIEKSRLHEIRENYKPASLSNEEYTHLIFESLEGFLFVFSNTGRIYYASDYITALLGYVPENVVNQHIMDYVLKEDQALLYNIMSYTEQGKEFRCQTRFQKKSLICESPVYEQVQLTGFIQVIDHSDDAGEDSKENMDKILFICTGRMCNPQLVRDVTFYGPNGTEFTSRHSMEWKFLFLDHRASPIIGYMPFEVLGTSGYDYYHFDDLDQIVHCHQTLMRTGALTSGFYRFLTKGQQWIWLQTRFFITYHQWNSKPEFIMCTHRVVSFDERFCNSNNIKKKEDNIKNVIKENVTQVNNQEQGNIRQQGNAKTNGADKLQSILATMASPKNLPPPSKMHNVDQSAVGATEQSILNMPTTRQMTTMNGPQGLNMTGQMCTMQPQVNMGGMFTGNNAASNVVNPNTMQTCDYQQMPRFSRPVSQLPIISMQVTNNFGGVGLNTYPNASNNAYVMRQIDNGSQYNGPQSVHAREPKWSTNVPEQVVPTDNNNGQDELLHKHDQLQLLIVQQQEELRQLKEQLTIARLGIPPEQQEQQQLQQQQQQQLQQQQQQQLQQQQLQQQLQEQEVQKLQEQLQQQQQRQLQQQQQQEKEIQKLQEHLQLQLKQEQLQKQQRQLEQQEHIQKQQQDLEQRQLKQQQDQIHRQQIEFQQQQQQFQKQQEQLHQYQQQHQQEQQHQQVQQLHEFQQQRRQFQNQQQVHQEQHLQQQDQQRQHLQRQDQQRQDQQRYFMYVPENGVQNYPTSGNENQYNMQQ